jgi:Ca-activated chloride channel homolog
MIRSFAVVSFFALAALPAQGLLIGPAPNQDPPGQSPPNQTRPISVRPAVPVTIERTQIAAEIVDGVATTTIDQVFRNSGPRDEEGTWFLPLPAGAVADHFTMTVGGKEIAGEVLDAGRARSVYEAIVRQRRDPGLLEYAGDGLLRARVYPIPANGEVAVKVRLRVVLTPVGDVYEWKWPLRAARCGDATAGPLGVTVKITSQTPIASVVTPHAGASIQRRGDGEATVSLEGQTGEFEDLSVIYGLKQKEFGLHLLPYRTAADAGFFAMLISPPRSLDGQKLQRRFVQFVVDTSGSMRGEKIEQAKAALEVFLKSLRPDDFFHVTTFASSVESFASAPQPATRERIDEALARVRQLAAGGGTNIGDALRAAFSAPLPADVGKDVLRQIVFVTDGQATVGLTNPQQILEATKGADAAATRLFALGVGNEIDVRLIDDLVRQHRGARDFVRNEERIETKVDALCQKLAQPALTDVEVRCDDLDAFQVHPSRIDDLFCGDVLQVVGRYRNSGSKLVRVRGKQNGVEREFVFEVEFPAVAAKHEFVQTLWARQHIATLLDAIRRNGQKAELVAEVRELATRYGIVTPYTSQLILEEGDRLAGFARRDAAVGTWTTAMPEDRWGDLSGAAGGGVQRGPATRGVAPASPSAGLPALGRLRSGEEAVAESLEVGGDAYQLNSGAKAVRSIAANAPTSQRGVVRRAAGRVFLSIGEELVEQGLPADWEKQAVVVEAFSEAYFELLKKQPALREVLALGDRITFRDGERIVRVQPAAPPRSEPAPKGETPPKKEGEAPKSTGG